jgi:SAM-dependent methyltransferase
LEGIIIVTADFSSIPNASPNKILQLRESAFATDLFITAVSYFDFFNHLDKYPGNINDICIRLGIQSRPADVMLTLFKAYGLIKEKRGIYILSGAAHDYLVERSAYDLSSYVSSLKDSPVCQAMRQVLETGRPANWAAAKSGKEWATAMEQAGFAESFTAAMNSRGTYLAHGLIKAVDLRGSHRLLDIGGGSGIYAIKIVQNQPGLKAAVFEKPPVDKAARYSVNKFELSDRIKIIAGDVFKDKLPGGYDIHLISHVLHDWDWPEVRAILKNSYTSLEPGGKIILHDAHINRRKTGPVSVAEYSVLLMFLSEGKCYSIKEMGGVLTETGFRNIETKATLYNRSIITAVK